MGKLEAGDRTKKVEHNLRVARLPIIDTTSGEKVQKRLNEYFEMCIEDDVFATVAGLASALGISRQALYRWLNGDIRKPTDVMMAVEWGMGIINAQTEESLMDGKGNVVGQIFLTKNNFPDYTDTREVVMTNTTPVITAEELLKRAAKLPGFDRERLEDNG